MLTSLSSTVSHLPFFLGGIYGLPAALSLLGGNRTPGSATVAGHLDMSRLFRGRGGGRRGVFGGYLDGSGCHCFQRGTRERASNSSRQGSWEVTQPPQAKELS